MWSNWHYKEIAIYFSTVHCHLTYCVVIWGSANKTAIDELESLQKRALKAAHKLPIPYATELLFSTQFPTMLRVAQMYKFAVCIYIFCSVNNPKHHTLNFPNNFNRYTTQGILTC